MRRVACIGIGIGLCVTASAAGKAVPKDLTPEDVEHWSWHLVPLPRQFAMTQSVVLAPDEAAIDVRADAPALVKQAAKELREAIGGAEPAGAAAFTIRLRNADGQDAETGRYAAEIAQLPNADQAYRIVPNTAGDGLLLVGGGERGTYYATKTLQQFINAKRTGGEPAPDKNTPVPHRAAKVRIPLVTITDWPDLQDRGLWGGDSYNHLRWMSDRKMNYDEQIATNGIDKQGKPYIGLASGKQRMIDEGPTYGINPVPVVLHLEQLSNYGIFDAYPELRGKNGRAGSICYSNPRFSEILAQWLLLWRQKPGVKEVDVWMAENLQGEKGCQCEGCAKEDRSVLEARAIVTGWRKAREKDPALEIRVLTSEETEKANPQVFAELPPNMKIWYYHSLFTYNTSEKPMLRPYLSEFISQGRWIGVCPNLSAHVGTWQPFTGPQFIHYRMNEFVAKKLGGLIGYAVPCLPHVEFNTEAAAEWAWNAKGRTPRQFAFSFAVRRGMKDPEQFADWCDLHGPVAWDVYGSDWPSGEKRGVPGPVAELLKKGKLPAFGEVLWDVYGMPWGEIKSAEQLAKNVAAEDRALELARAMADPALLQETLVIHGYIHALQALAELKGLVTPDGVADKDKPAARKSFATYIQGMRQAQAAIPEWERIVAKGLNYGPYTPETARHVGERAEQMEALARELGCAP